MNFPKRAEFHDEIPAALRAKPADLLEQVFLLHVFGFFFQIFVKWSIKRFDHRYPFLFSFGDSHPDLFPSPL